MNITDRSRIIAYQTCPRMRFLLYHALGTGITQTRENLALSVGSAVHKGIEYILTASINNNIIEERSANLAIMAATKEFSDLIHQSELDLEQDEDHLFVLQEQKALIEALIWVWYLVQYPKLISEYEVLYVEKEIEWNLVESDRTFVCGFCNQYYGDGICPKHGTIPSLNNGILFLSRPDAILRDRSTGGLVVYSLKTASSWTETNDKQSKYDDQGISELIAVEKLMDEKVEAIKMEYLLKGSRKKMKDYSSDEYVKMQSSFLVHPYMRDGLNEEYALMFQGRPPKGWRRINIWEEMEMRRWIEYLVENHYEELEKQIVTPYTYNRNEEDIENWLQQNEYQEREIIANLNTLKEIESDLVGPRESNKSQYKMYMNRYFPQRRKECFQYGGFCQFVDHCWEGVKVTSQEFKARIPNHPRELVELKGMEK